MEKGKIKMSRFRLKQLSGTGTPAEEELYNIDDDI